MPVMRDGVVRVLVVVVLVVVVVAVYTIRSSKCEEGFHCEEGKLRGGGC